MEQNEDIDKLVLYIQHLADKPGIYSISNSNEIFHFLQGYNSASHDPVNNFLHEFGEYVNSKLIDQHFPNSTNFQIGWNNWIRFLTSTDYGSIKLFKELFEGYLESINWKK